MKITRNFIMIAFIILLCSWGEKGHQKISSSAPLFFPVELSNFKGWSEKLSKYSSEADNRKKYDHTEGVKHYIDIDAYTDFNENHRIAEAENEAINKYGKDFIMKNGTLPWVTDSTYQVLVNQFRSKDWAKAVLTAADLGHYVGDGYMPLHLTINYDGKLTGQAGIHSRNESNMINQYVDQITVASSPTQNIHNVRRYIFVYIYGNYQYKDSILNADKVAFQKANHEYSDLYYQTLWDQTRAMTIRLIAGSSKSLAELIITAWVEAGSPSLPSEINVEKTTQN